MTMKEGLVVVQPQAKEHLSHQKLEETAGSMPCSHLDFYFQPTVKEKALLIFLNRFQVYSVIIQHLCVHYQVITPQV